MRVSRSVTCVPGERRMGARALLIGSILSVVTACGGGGSSTSNRAPTVFAGDDLTAPSEVGGWVETCCSSASDPDGDTVFGVWEIVSQPQGANAVLETTQAVNPRLSADVPGTYILQVTGSDRNGGTDTDRLTVTLTNQPPAVTADSAESALVGSPMGLDAVVEDPNGHGFGLSVEVVRRPPGGGSATLDALADPMSVVFDTAGTYRVKLVATDDFGAVGSDEFEVTAVSAVIGFLEAFLIDAEFNQATGRMVVVETGALHILDPDTGDDSIVPLDDAPVAVSVSASGAFAAVAHTRKVSVVDLVAGTVIGTYPTFGIWTSDIVLAPNGWIYAFEKGIAPYSETLHMVEMVSGAYVEGPSTGDNMRVALHPDGDAIYAIEPGEFQLSIPNTIQRYGLTPGAATEERRWAPTFDGTSCAGVWLNRSGNRLLTDCGEIRQIFSSDDSSLSSIGSIEIQGRIASADFSLTRNAWLVVEFGAHSSALRKTFIFDADTLEARDPIPIPSSLGADGEPDEWRPIRVFVRDSDDATMIIASVSDGGVAPKYALFTIPGS
jgi:K319-like protein